MSEFTKGPWTAINNGYFFQISIPWETNGEVDKYCRNIASAYHNEANANLIAAAPDMYEALETVCGACVYVKLAGEKCCEYCVIRKALRKARGEEE